jgi:transposase
MYVKKSYNKGRLYLSICHGYRENGKNKSKTIQKLGYYDELQLKYDDPLEHFKKVAKEMTLSTVTPPIEISLVSRLDDHSNLRKNLGYCAPKHIYGLLELNKFFQKHQNKRKKIGYNLNQIFSLLLFNRFLEPSSKKRAYESVDIFFERSNFTLDDIYRSLDIFSEISLDLQKHLNGKVTELVGRNNSLSYYDVTNYYFEIPYNDEDEIAEDGRVINTGLRKKGMSKEHRKTPIVQMGLLMDSNGLPLAYNSFPGNESEKTSLLPTVRRVKKDFEIERVIIVADRGLNTSDNIALIAGKNLDSRHNDGYVYGQSVLGADSEFKAWVLEKNGYVRSEEVDEDGNVVIFTHKSRVKAKTIQLKNQNGARTQKIDTCQRQMVYYSEKYAKKQSKEREQTLQKARDLIENPGKYTRATSYGATAYIKNIKFVKSTGEIPDGLDLSLDIKKIEKESKFDGYYSIVTSEIELSDKEIRDVYRGLWKIEESFRIMKSEFNTRPIYHRLEDRINAHFLVCFVSLLIMRILELKLNHDYSAGMIRESIKKYGCSHLDQNHYLFDYRDDIIKSIEKEFGFDLGKKIMSLSEIKKILVYPK